MHGPGNKSLALFMAARYLQQNFLGIVTTIITIDDDTNIPSKLRIPKDFGIHHAYCVAIKADTSSGLMISYLQSFQYMLSDCVHIAFSKYGSVFAHHGCIGIWRLDSFIQIMEYHDTLFDGEDLLESIIGHLYAIKMKNGLPFRMGMIHNVFVETKPPLMWGGWFWQQADSWLPVESRYTGRILRILLFDWKASTLVWKPILLIQLWTLLMDILRIPIVATLFIGFPEKRESVLWSLFGTLIITYATLFWFNYVTLNRENQVPAKAVLAYPLFGFLYLFVLRPLAMFKQIFVYWPNVKADIRYIPEKIGEKIRTATLPTIEIKTLPHLMEEGLPARHERNLDVRPSTSRPRLSGGQKDRVPNLARGLSTLPESKVEKYQLETKGISSSEVITDSKRTLHKPHGTRPPKCVSNFRRDTAQNCSPPKKPLLTI
eukprot:g3738.t1